MREDEHKMARTPENEQPRRFEDLTLAEFLQQWWQAPRHNGELLRDWVEPHQQTNATLDGPLVTTLPRSRATGINQGGRFRRQTLRLTLYLLAFLVAVFGNSILIASDGAQTRRSEAVQLAAGAPYLLLALVIWLIAEGVAHWPTLRQWWSDQARFARIQIALRTIPITLMLVAVGIFAQAASAPTTEALQLVTPGVQLVVAGLLLWLLLDVSNAVLHNAIKRRASFLPRWLITAQQAQPEPSIARHSPATNNTPWYMRLDPMRLVYALCGTITSVIVWLGSSDNRIPTPIIYAWLLSAVFWSLALAPDGLRIRWRLANWITQLRNSEWRRYSWVFVVLAVVLAFGVAFRFDRLAEHPREMTDDHVELILDAGLVREGLRAIFFANNGGREPVQMYTIAAASYLPGLGIDHETIKIVAAVQSLLTLPIFFWLGFEIIGGDNKRLKLLMGVLAAALLATSYWHVTISRQALRIVLTPPITALLLIFLARALRHNRRADFIISGLLLGYGLYMYQAVRMLPLVIVLAVGLALYFSARTWRQRAQYIFNLSVLVFISFIVFLPMFHYSLEEPELFWRRTTGRLLGDDIITETLADGSIRQREASVNERLQAFEENVPVLLSNVRNVLLMFNWRGDGAAITGVPNQPALDIYTGALFIVGLGAWSIYAIRQRDLVLWLVPLGLFVMLLPSALSIAFPNENPSHTRTSGAIPFVYIILAFPLALAVDQLWRYGARGLVLATSVSAAIFIGSYNFNTRLYFGEYPQIYADSFDPYTEPGQFLAGFAQSNGSYGNAFMIGFPHWWSHRAIGLAGGLETRWPNGIVSRDQIPTMIEAAAGRVDQFRLDPDKDLLFFYSPSDVETEAHLQMLFPEGRTTLYETYARNDDFMWYMVPALGTEGLTTWLRDQSSN